MNETEAERLRAAAAACSSAVGGRIFGGEVGGEVEFGRGDGVCWRGDGVRTRGDGARGFLEVSSRMPSSSDGGSTCLSR